MSYIFHVNGNYSSCNNRNIEKFSLNIGNSTTTSDTITMEKLTEIEKNINQKMVVEGTSKMISAVVNEVANENIADLNQMIALSNEIDISKVKGDGDFNLSNVKQAATSDSQTSITAQQNIQTKIVTDISNKIANKVSSIIGEVIDNKRSNTQDLNESSDVGSTLLGLGQAYGKAAADILSIGIGNSTSKTTNTASTEKLKDTFKLDNSFELKKNNETSDKINNALSSKNMSKCAKDSNQSNKFKLSEIEVGGNISLDNIEQVASIKTVLTCAFNQTVLTEIATNIVNDLDENIERMQTSNQKYADDNNIKSTSGDVYAAGVAGKAILEGVGTAAVGVGEGVSTAALGVGEGVSTGAQGIGKGIGSAMSGMIMPLIGIFLILVMGYFIYNQIM
jgi:hypothetical protein